MSYKISPGISVDDLPAWLREAAKKYGVFDDGRVNYTDAPIAPIVMCTIVCGREILLAKRGYGLADAEGYWSTINGFIDEIKPIKEQVKQEIREELSVKAADKNIKISKSYTLNNPKEKRSYIVFPCRVLFATKPKIILDHEHTDYVWTTRDEVETYHILDDLPHAIDAALTA